MKVPDGLRVDSDEESTARTEEWRRSGEGTPRPPPGVLWSLRVSAVFVIFGLLLVIGAFGLPIHYLCDGGTYPSGNKTISYDSMCYAPNPAIFLGIVTIALGLWMRRSLWRRTAG